MAQSERKSHKIHRYHQLVGSSPFMLAVYEKIDKIAKSDASVFITGETGTGKELCAQAIHLESARKNQPFVPLNCAAIPFDLMENELFGHVKGGYTGADKEQLGVISLADGGTLFLDEIGDMDLILQAKLLRFLQDGTFHKVGSPHEEKADVRVICATHRNPRLEIEAGRFRADLFYRLKVVSIHLHALHRRGNDVLLVAQTFLEKYAKIEKKRFKNFSTMAEKVLLNYKWPGNVRQLNNIIHGVVVMHDGSTVSGEMLLSALDEEGIHTSNNVTKTSKSTKSTQETFSNTCVAIISDKGFRPLKEIEKEVIFKAIEFCEGNVVKASKILKVSQGTLYKKLKQWKIQS